MLLSACSKFLSIHKPLALAVCIIENNTPEACAPFSVLENKKFFPDITNGLTARSAKLFDISRYPYSLYVNNSSNEFLAYLTAFSSKEPGCEFIFHISSCNESTS